MEQQVQADIGPGDERSAGYRYALTVVTPTYNERENVPALIERLGVCLAGTDWNIIVVDDDSPDGTAGVVRALSLSQTNIECIHRKGRRGLAGAVAEGIMAASAPFVAVIDADLQHDEKALPEMLAMLSEQKLDLVVSSRFKHTRTTGGLSQLRNLASHVANSVANMFTRTRLTDPMSGYFMIRRARFVEISDKIYPEGFKILFNIIMVAKKPLQIQEVGVEFAPRLHGQSKLNTKVMFDFFGLLLWHNTGCFIPPRFLPFATVGTIGLCVHVTTLYLTRELEFFVSQLIAILLTMAINYSLNNVFTYADRKKRGWEFIKGYVVFSMACTAGALINFSVAMALALVFVPEIVAGLIGAISGGIWNFIATGKTVWESKEIDAGSPRH